MDLEEIGQLIRKRREFLNLRQEDLAELSKLGNKTIIMIEQGSGNSSFKTLQKVAEVLGLEIFLKIKQIS